MEHTPAVAELFTRSLREPPVQYTRTRGSAGCLSGVTFFLLSVSKTLFVRPVLDFDVCHLSLLKHLFVFPQIVTVKRGAFALAGDQSASSGAILNETPRHYGFRRSFLVSLVKTD